MSLSDTPTKVFVSYSRTDAATFADELVSGLEFHGGFEVTIDRHSIVEGEDWRQRLNASIAAADTVVFILSPGSAKSPICQWEVDEAAKLSKRILPVLWIAPGDAAVPPQLSRLHYTRFDEGRSFMGGLRALVAALNTDLDWLRDHTRFLTRAIEWDSDERAANRLLIGKDIEEMKAWASRRPRNAPDLTPLHLDFIQASEAAETERFEVEKKQLADRERLLADLQTAVHNRDEAITAREEAQRRRSKMQKALISLMLLTVGALGFGAWMNLELDQQARYARVAGEGIEQARSSISHLLSENDPTVALKFRTCGNGVRVIKSIANETDAATWQNSYADFWKLYFGDFIMLEEIERKTGGYSPIARTMVRLGQDIKKFQTEPPSLPLSQYVNEANAVLDACVNFFVPALPPPPLRKD